MLVEEAVVLRLRADAAVSAIAGNRIRPLTLEQLETLPAIQYQKVSDVPDYAMGGQTGISEARIALTAWTTKSVDGTDRGYAQCKALAEAVRLCLSGWSGTVECNGDSLRVDSVQLENQTDLFDPEVSRGMGMCGIASDYIISYRQEKPSWP